MKPDIRKKFLIILGNCYEKYGYPAICGWIEGLLSLERKEWTQKAISRRLTEDFSEIDSPTSLASVNRALKILEAYGIVSKSGSRKLGYIYQVASSSNIMTAMFDNFITANKAVIQELSFLREKFNAKDDKELYDVIEGQIDGYTLFNRILEGIISSFSELERVRIKEER